MQQSGCVLCDTDGGAVVFRNNVLRIVQADEAGFPAFYRIVWNRHVAGFSCLSETERTVCINAVVVVEQALRGVLQPDQVNLAALGNLVPHLHWHVVARFAWDSHFPASVWSAPLRPVDSAALARVASRCDAVGHWIAATMAT